VPPFSTNREPRAEGAITPSAGNGRDIRRWADDRACRWVGALAGAAATAGLLRDDQAPIAAATNQALQDSVEKFGAELAALKAGLGTAQRNAHAQFGKLAERLDRTEKAQSEPVAKIAKIAESLDRVERRIAQASPDITGSISAAKAEAKLPAAVGWHLRDFYAGRAVVESRSGRLFEVGPGSNLPGQSRRSARGRQVVVLAQRHRAAALQPRRRAIAVPRLILSLVAVLTFAAVAAPQFRVNSFALRGNKDDNAALGWRS
jgi:hypothetical protein